MTISAGHEQGPTTLAVIGAGVMGTGIAHRAARSGMTVALVDPQAPARQRARDDIARDARFAPMFLRRTDLPSPQAILERIAFEADLTAAAGVDAVVECVPEQWEIKRDVLRRLDEVCGANAFFASCTSAIPITRLASATARPDRVVGMHFMNPAHIKSFVEVVRGHHTSDRTLASARALAARMAMTAVTVEDAPGFVTNRVLMLTINEAIWVAHDRVAAAADIDRIFKGCFGHPMGPLETADLIGLDTILLSLEVLQDAYGDPKFRPCPLLQRMVHAGLLGRKTGKGFYDHAPDGDRADER